MLHNHSATASSCQWLRPFVHASSLFLSLTLSLIYLFICLFVSLCVCVFAVVATNPNMIHFSKNGSQTVDLFTFHSMIITLNFGFSKLARTSANDIFMDSLSLFLSTHTQHLSRSLVLSLLRSPLPARFMPVERSERTAENEHSAIRQ